MTSTTGTAQQGLMATVLLIGGHARSGTTLLRHLCNSHRDMVVTNELDFLSGLGRGYARHSMFLLRRLWGRTLNGIAFGYGIGPARRGAAFAARYLTALRRNEGGVIDVASVQRALGVVYPHARVVGDKTPHYVFLLDSVAGTPGLSCLIIYRDCRDVVSSMLERVRTVWRKRSWSRNADSAEKVATRWVRSIELMERHQAHICSVRYEDLVARPRSELERVAQWLAVDPEGFAEARIRSVAPASVGKYRTGLTPDELATVMHVAGPTMARLGYA